MTTSQFAPTFLVLEDQDEALRGLLVNLFEAGVVAEAPPEQLQWREARARYLDSLSGGAIPIVIKGDVETAIAALSDWPIDLGILDLTVRRSGGALDPRGGLEVAQALRKVNPDATRVLLSAADRAVFEASEGDLVQHFFKKGARGSTFQAVTDFLLTWLGDRPPISELHELLNLLVAAWRHSWPWADEAAAEAFLGSMPKIHAAFAPVSNRALQPRGRGHGPKGAARIACGGVGRIGDVLLNRLWTDTACVGVRSSVIRQPGGPIARVLEASTEPERSQAVRAWHNHVAALRPALRDSQAFRDLQPLEKLAGVRPAQAAQWTAARSSLAAALSPHAGEPVVPVVAAAPTPVTPTRSAPIGVPSTQLAAADVAGCAEPTGGGQVPLGVAATTATSGPATAAGGEPQRKVGSGEVPTKLPRAGAGHEDQLLVPGVTTVPGPLQGEVAQPELLVPVVTAHAGSPSEGGPPSRSLAPDVTPALGVQGGPPDADPENATPPRPAPTAPSIGPPVVTVMPPAASPSLDPDPVRGPPIRSSKAAPQTNVPDPERRAAASAALRRHAEDAQNDPWNAVIMQIGAFNLGEIPDEPAGITEFAEDVCSDLRRYLAVEPLPRPEDPLVRYLSGRTVWLIDDHASTWQGCFRQLFGPDCALRVFPNVDAAIRIVGAHRPDIIVLDLYVPVVPDSQWPCPMMIAALASRGIGPSTELHVPAPRHAELCLDLLADLMPDVPVVIFTRSREARLARRALDDWGAAGLAFKNLDQDDREAADSRAGQVFSDLREAILRALRRRADWQLRLPVRRLERRDPEVRDLRQWISQFDAIDRPLALEMISRIRRIDASALERLFTNAVERLLNNEEWTPKRPGLVLVAAGRQGKSGASMFYQLWHLPLLAPFRQRLPMVLLSDLDEAPSVGGNIELGGRDVPLEDLRILLVDDFVGSGGTAAGAAKTAATRMAGLGISAPARRIGFLAACAVPKGKDALEKAFSATWIGDPDIPVVGEELASEAAGMGTRLQGKFGRLVVGAAAPHRSDPTLAVLRPDGEGELRAGDLAYADSGRGPAYRVERQEGAVYVAHQLGRGRRELGVGRFTLQSCLTKDARTYEPLGFADTAALLAFDYNIPNNCPPVLWGSENGWRPVFSRRT